MKKVISLLLVFALCMGLWACGNDDNQTTNPSETEQITTEGTQETTEATTEDTQTPTEAPLTESEGLEYQENDDGTLAVIGIGTCTDSHVVIPAYFNGAKVTYIADYAFYECSSLTGVTIPDGVTGIGICAFCGCLNLTDITIPEGVTSIADAAFSWCIELTSITIPDGVISIGNGAFQDCKGLTSITIPNSVTSIGYNAFYNCGNLEEIRFNGTVYQWNTIDLGGAWCEWTGSFTIYCTDGETSKYGKQGVS